MALRPDVDLRRSGPERIIFDIRNGVIPQLLHIDARALGRFDNPLGERGSNQRSHGRAQPRPLQLGPASSNALAIISVWSGLKLVCESRDRIGMALLPRSVTRSLLPFSEPRTKHRGNPVGRARLPQCVLLRELPPLAPRTREALVPSSRGLSAYLPRERSALLRLGPAFFTTRFTPAFDLPEIEGGRRGLAKMREPSDLSKLGAFSRNRAVMSFIALDRSNTGSAKNTPKSDMDLLARIQHLASVNWASHRMVARSPTSRAPGPAARSRMLVDIFLSLSRLS